MKAKVLYSSIMQAGNFKGKLLVTVKAGFLKGPIGSKIFDDSGSSYRLEAIGTGSNRDAQTIVLNPDDPEKKLGKYLELDVFDL